MPKKLDLTNQIFDTVKVLCQSTSKNGKTYWECECTQCGTKKIIQGAHLTGGQIRSCGCHCGVETKYAQTDLENKKCEICGKLFKPILFGGSRKYCFDCVPRGLDLAERTKFKRQAAKREGVRRLGGVCKKCGENRPYILAFHHLDPSIKDDVPSKLLGNSQFDAFFEEIKKCILLCNNCHGEFHYLEANNGITIDEYLDPSKS